MEQLRNSQQKAQVVHKIKQPSAVGLNLPATPRVAGFKLLHPLP